MTYKGLASPSLCIKNLIRPTTFLCLFLINGKPRLITGLWRQGCWAAANLCVAWQNMCCYHALMPKSGDSHAFSTGSQMPPWNRYGGSRAICGQERKGQGREQGGQGVLLGGGRGSLLATLADSESYAFFSWSNTPPPPHPYSRKTAGAGPRRPLAARWPTEREVENIFTYCSQAISHHSM